MSNTTTPARRQYLSLKEQHPDVVLFFRMGDFYETFDDDAKVVAEVLDIALTSREMGRGNRVPMAGIPYHSADSYLSRLLSAGHKVAIAEQLSEPDGKGIVDREVTSIVTPGTVTNPELITGSGNTFLAALISEGKRAGLAFADASTGEFATTRINGETQSELLDIVRRELQRINPAEVVVPDSEPLLNVAGDRVVLSSVNPLAWREDEAEALLLEHFGVSSLEPFGCEGEPLAIRSGGALLAYLRRTQRNNLRQITSLYTYSTDRFMSLDAQTRRNLEIDESSSRHAGPSLFSTIDATTTPVGSRLLRRWLGQPLLDRDDIEARYDGVEWFVAQALARANVRDLLKGMADMERIINRIANRQAGPREVVRLGDALRRVPDLQSTLTGDAVPSIIGEIPECPDVADEILAAIIDDPPIVLGGGSAIRQGYSPDLDGLRNTLRADREYIAGLEAEERERTGFKNLKVGFNKVFGYYLEISNASRGEVPEHYIRKQTLVNAERYITPELKEAEQRVASAEERIAAAEAETFDRLVGFVSEYAASIRAVSRAIATTDCLASLAEIAATRGYVRPDIADEDVLEIDAGRHPTVELEMPAGAFVANDACLSDQSGRIAIITGPNMAGKSTFLRQVALIVLLAQIGSFVPANSMRFGLTDRIFTRIGAQDDLASGQSTFMVEMLETATILNHATPRSLVVLDEIGRGTSTYDGLAIATAIVEYIHNTPRLGSKTLFATHYHELTALAGMLPHISNYRVDVLESGDEITFLYRVVPGGADRSYGVYVAQLAGMPRGVIRRAEDILADLEHSGTGGRQHTDRAETIASQPSTPMQLSFFGANHPAIERLQELEIDALSPLDALTRLYEIKSLIDNAASASD